MDLIAKIDLYDLIRFVRFLAKRLLIYNTYFTHNGVSFGQKSYKSLQI